MDIVREKKSLLNKYKSVFIAGLVVVLLIVFTFLTSTLGVPKVKRESIVVGSAKRGLFAREVRGPGILVSEEFRVLAASVPARIERVLLKPGSEVKIDTVIIQLSSPDLLEQLAQAGWDVENQKHELVALKARLITEGLKLDSDFAALQAEYENALAQLEAETTLTASGVVSKLQIRKSQSRLTGLEKQVSIAKKRTTQSKESTSDQLQAQSERVKYLTDIFNRRSSQVENLQVKSGINGVLQQVSVEEGQRVSAGTNLARVANPEKLAAELSISETQAEEIRRGQTVRVNTHRGIVEGAVLRIDPGVKNGVVQIDVELTGEIPENARLDLSVDGTIEIERVTEAIYIGRPIGAKANGPISLMVLNADKSEAERRTIQLGRLSDTSIEILGGLTPGEQVILSDISAFSDHDLIKIR